VIDAVAVVVVMREALNEKQIAQLVKQYPLPDDVPDAVLNRDQLAKAFSTSVNTITAWIDKGMPMLAAGKNGQGYEFQLSQCWAWRQADLADQQRRSDEADEAVKAMQLALIGGETGNGIDSLAPRDKREILMAQLAMEDFQRQRNELIRREDVVALLEDVFSLFRDGVGAFPDQLERKAGISGKAIELAFDAGDELLIELKQKIEAFFAARPLRTGSDKAKRDLFDA